MRLLFFFSLLLTFSTQLDILYYLPVIGQSHISFVDSLLKLLQEKGHKVDVVFAYYNDRVKVDESKIRPNQSYLVRMEEDEVWFKKTPHLVGLFEEVQPELEDMPAFYNFVTEFCELAMSNKSLMNFMRRRSYDIALTGSYDPCGAMLLRIAGIPVIASVTPTPLFPFETTSIGLPIASSVYSSILTPKHDGGFFDKTFHFLRSTYLHYVRIPSLYSKFDSFARKNYGDAAPTAAESMASFDVVFVNTNEIVAQPRPISHKIKYIGGIGMKKAEKLDQNFERILSSKKGAVLFSFGTQVLTKDMPIEIRQNFVRAFSSFPEFVFLWKYTPTEDDHIIFNETNKNIELFDWLPQTALLADARMKAFICHMGLNSYLEASLSGVPFISIPLFVDQHHNALNAKSRGTGVILKKHELTEEAIKTALRTVLYDGAYLENAKNVAKFMRMNPEKPEDRFIQWVEYSARNPGLHKILNLPGTELSPFFYYSGDVIVMLILLIMTSIHLMVKTLIMIPKLRIIEKVKRH